MPSPAPQAVSLFERLFHEERQCSWWAEDPAAWSPPPAFGKQDKQKGGGGQGHGQIGRGSGPD